MVPGRDDPNSIASVGVVGVHQKETLRNKYFLLSWPRKRDLLIVHQLATRISCRMSHHTTRQVGTIAVCPNVHFECRRKKKVKGTAIMKAKPTASGFNIATVQWKAFGRVLFRRHSVIQSAESECGLLKCKVHRRPPQGCSHLGKIHVPRTRSDEMHLSCSSSFSN
jgi:hypothetical protein